MARPTKHRCIWCLSEKDEGEFNIEHVVPEAFGTFEDNLTLKNTVCEGCNSYFSRELEPWISRDSFEGFERFRRGQKSPEDFKSLGTRSTTRSKIADGLYAGAAAFTIPGRDDLALVPFAQVGFASSPDGPFRWFLLGEIPSATELSTAGVSTANVRTCGADLSVVAALFKERGITLRDTEEFAAPSGRVRVEHVFRPTLAHRRALAKIAFNYLAKQHGARIAFESRFDWIRDFVLKGAEPARHYYQVDEHPMIEGDKQNGKRFGGHVLTVYDRKDGRGVEAVVSLYNWLRHGFLLSEEPGLPESRGHFFDVDQRIISALSPP